MCCRSCDRRSALVQAGKFGDEIVVRCPSCGAIIILDNDPGAPQVNYFIATAYQALGDDEKAQEFYQKAAQQESGRSQTRYYQALAFAQLGEKEKADQIFDRLITTGSDMLTEDTSGDFFAKFGGRQTKNVRLAHAHYVTGLGHLGNGPKEKAKDNFTRAVELNVNHIWANFELSQLK